MKLEKFTGLLEDVDEAVCKKLEELNFEKLSDFVCSCLLFHI